MRNGIAIEATGLGKRYRLGASRSVRAHEALARAIRAALGRRQDPGVDDFWAVQDCTFSIGRGEVAAILGSNGAGKSVLLKMLSRIIKPTAGEAVLRGRVVSLLELGSGFHPDMTGRENIFLNGAILGMPRALMARQSDRIVDFADLARFIDEPVKRYSSGMYARLAFSVAAHVDADIILLDEVLAVGDAGFQERCLAHIRLAAARGATILLVSHSLDLVETLCTRGIILDSGTIVFDGPASAALRRYRGEAAPCD